MFSTALTLVRALDNGLFDAVPQKKKLTAQLARLVRYQSRQQWSLQYDLLADRFRAGLSRTEYAESMRKDLHARGGAHVTGFKATSVRKNEAVLIGPEEWTIFGCARFTDSKVTHYYKGQVTAALVGDKWQFSPVLIESPLDGPPVPCDAR